MTIWYMTSEVVMRGIYCVLLFLICINSQLSASSAHQQTNFGRLYGQAANFSLQTKPGEYDVAPLPIKYTASCPGYGDLKGSFGLMPNDGVKVVLKSLNYSDIGIDTLANFQYFSGYRWFWVQSDGMMLTPIEGGFYDLSAQTLPSNISISFDKNLFSFRWRNPSATNYGTKVIFEETSYPNSTLINASNAVLVYAGHEESADFIYHPTPGRYLNIGFFGMYELFGMQIDSGAGIQYWKNGSGAYEAIGGVHQAKAYQFDKLRRKISLQVPIIDSLSGRVFKVIPQHAPQPLDTSIAACQVSTPPTSCYLAWPKVSEHFQIFGTGWRLYEHQLLLNGRSVPYPGSGSADESRVLEWKDNYIRVSLPATLLNTTTPCIDQVYQVTSRVYPGLDSNEIKVRITNANVFYAQNCRD